MYKLLNLLIGCFLLITSTVLPCVGQDADNDTTGYVDKTDLRAVLFGKKQAKKETGVPVKGKLMSFIVPIIASNPSMGISYGIGGTGAIYFGKPETTSISNLTSSILYTTKNQFLANFKGTVMTNENKWEMLIDLRFSIFSQSTYGLGSDYTQPIQESWSIGGIETTGIQGGQPMTYNQVKIHYTLLREIKKYLYVGIGYALDGYENIDDLDLDLNAENPVITSHYAYSKTYGFDTTGYYTSGINFDVVHDSRDNSVNTYKGNFLQVSASLLPTFLGSQKNYSQLYLEARLFKSLSESVPRNVLAFWFLGQFTTVGGAPYMQLPAIGYDMRNRSGRGYVQGRFRGPSWITAVTEYRFRITNNGLLGGVLFANMTTTSRPESVVGTTTLDKLNLFEAIRPAGGFGARIMLNRAARLNLGLDMAWGERGSKGFYFVVGETF